MSGAGFHRALGWYPYDGRERNQVVPEPVVTTPHTHQPGARVADDRATRAPLADVALLVVSLAAVAVVSVVGSQWTETADGSWYDRLDLPPWNPPGAVFGIVWTILYVLMAVAAWLVARRGLAEPGVRVAVVLYVVQLLLNLAWTAVFFGFERPGWALAEIGLLAVAITATIWAFARVSAAAAWLLAPYLAWVLFASSLNLAIVVLNAE